MLLAFYVPSASHAGARGLRGPAPVASLPATCIGQAIWQTHMANSHELPPTMPVEAAEEPHDYGEGLGQQD